MIALVHDDGVGDDAFDRLIGMLDYPMFVVTTRADDELSGCLVGFATQTSIHPRRFLVGLSRSNHTCGVAARSDYLAVHVVARRHIGLARLFGGETGDRIDKFRTLRVGRRSERDADSRRCDRVVRR